MVISKRNHHRKLSALLLNPFMEMINAVVLGAAFLTNNHSIQSASCIPIPDITMQPRVRGELIFSSARTQMIIQAKVVSSYADLQITYKIRCT